MGMLTRIDAFAFTLGDSCGGDARMGESKVEEAVAATKGDAKSKVEEAMCDLACPTSKGD